MNDYKNIINALKLLAKKCKTIQFNISKHKVINLSVKLLYFILHFIELKTSKTKRNEHNSNSKHYIMKHKWSLPLASHKKYLNIS